MKRAVIIIIFSCVIVAVFFAIIINSYKVNVDFAQEGTVTFIYDEECRYSTLTDQELSIIKNIFSRNIMYVDNPSCGFTEDVSIKLNGSQTFCFANDGCPLIYWKEKNLYFRLKKDEQTQLYNILEKYGFYFPCI